MMTFLPLTDKEGNKYAAEELIEEIRLLIEEEYEQKTFIGREIKLMSMVVAIMISKACIGEKDAQQLMDDQITRDLLTKTAMTAFILYKSMVQRELQVDLKSLSTVAGEQGGPNDSSSCS